MSAFAEQFAQQLANGLLIGSFYALVALGYTIVYGIIRLINFAHGDFFMVGSFIGYTMLLALASTQLGSGVAAVAVALAVAMAVTGVLGALAERLAYRPLRAAPKISLLITAIGLSLTLEYGVVAIYGTRFRVYPVEFPREGFTLGGAAVSWVQVVLFLTAIALMLALHLFITRTLIGKAMRAIAIDQVAAQLMGINVDRVISVAFLLGTSLAAAAGVMMGVYYTQINFLMGFLMGLKAFTAAVIGGVGNIPGAMLGGLLLGVVEAFASAVVGGAWKDVTVFWLLIFMLVFRPTGILGERVVERV